MFALVVFPPGTPPPAERAPERTVQGTSLSRSALTCAESGEPFQCGDRDMRFYGAMGVPPPRLSPARRMGRRLAFRNERNLYRRRCDGTGQTIISMYSPDKAVPVYDNEYWWSDGWDALDYGREVDFTRPFFEQFGDLIRAVPKMARVQQGTNNNSRYTNCAGNNSNCYLCFSAAENEDCLYGQSINRCRECVDCLFLTQCEIAYESCYCVNSYDIHFCRDVHNSSFMRHCTDCRGCDHCFACVGLRRASYHVLNRPVSPEEFNRITNDPVEKLTLLQEYARLERTSPRLYTKHLNCENFSGGYLLNCKNTFDSWNCSELEDCRYCGNLRAAKNCYDVDFYGGVGANELLYECEGVGQGAFNVKFSKLIWGGSRDVLYSYECFGSNDIFGCAGLKRRGNCILNAQYSDEAFRDLSKRLEAHMMETGEWGEFFPVHLSPFGYNETLAFNYFPLTEEEASKRGWRWHSSAVIPAAERQLGDLVRLCARSDTPFRLIAQEEKFYEKAGLEPPTLRPEERHQDRINTVGGRRLYNDRCSSCGQNIRTMYDPAEHFTVLCEACYLRELM